MQGSRVSAARDLVDYLNQKLDECGKDSKLIDFWDDLNNFVKDREHLSIIERLDGRGIAIEHLECCNRLTPKFLMVKEALKVYVRVLDAYGNRAKQAELNQGVGWKALMHAVRVCEEAKELLVFGLITFPRPEAAYLLKIRTGQLSYKEVADKIESGLMELDDVCKKSTLPEKPDYDFAEQLIINYYKKSVLED